MTQPTMDFLKECVLDATANDYENLSTIAPEIEKWTAAEGHHFSVDELTKAIETLVNAGRLRVYKYSKSENKYLVAKYSGNELKDLWFSSR